MEQTNVCLTLLSAPSNIALVRLLYNSILRTCKVGTENVQDSTGN